MENVNGTFLPARDVARLVNKPRQSSDNTKTQEEALSEESPSHSAQATGIASPSGGNSLVQKALTPKSFFSKPKEANWEGGVGRGGGGEERGHEPQ